MTEQNTPFSWRFAKTKTRGFFKLYLPKHVWRALSKFVWFCLSKSILCKHGECCSMKTWKEIIKSTITHKLFLSKMKANWKKITSKDLLICLILTPLKNCWEFSSKNIVSYKYNCQNKFTDKVKSPFFVFNLMSKGPGTDISTFSCPRVNWQFTSSESMYPCIPPFNIDKSKPAIAATCSTSKNDN